MDMQWRNRFLQATKTQDIEGYLVREVLNFKASGGSQAEADELVGSIMDEYLKDPPVSKSLINALEDVGCAITGFCSSANHLFGDGFEERHYYREIPGNPAS